MKDAEKKVHQAIDRQCQSRGFAAPADVFIDLGILEKKKYDDWRAGKIPFLEAVCTANLHKLSVLLRMIHSCALQDGLKPSITCYRHKGKPLRFTKTGDPQTEKAYATHYVKAKEKKDVPEANETSSGVECLASEHSAQEEDRQ